MLGRSFFWVILLFSTPIFSAQVGLKKQKKNMDRTPVSKESVSIFFTMLSGAKKSWHSQKHAFTRKKTLKDF
jgi:hypothetical protein